MKKELVDLLVKKEVDTKELYTQETGAYNKFQLKQLSLAKEQGLSLANLDPLRWTHRQMEQQRLALVDGQDLSELDPTTWTCEQMELQRLALSAGKTIANIDPTEWHWTEWTHHLNIVVKCLVKGLDISEINPTKYKLSQLEAIYKAYCDGFDISALNPFDWSGENMEMQHKALKEGFDLSNYPICYGDYNVLQKELRELKAQKQANSEVK